MTVENAVLSVSLIAILYPLFDLARTFVAELRSKKLVVTDTQGDILVEFSPERVQQTDLKELELLHERIRRDKGSTLRAA